jgi:hypothetical protein
MGCGLCKLKFTSLTELTSKMSNNILILSIVLTVFVFVYVYRTCPAGELIMCLDSKSVIIDDVNDSIWIMRVLLEFFLE